MSDGAPVCNLPNLSQVPALQPGRMFPSVPKAQDLPSAVQAVNALAQIVAQLAAPGLPPFRNNLAPLTETSQRFAGTPGIAGAAGADASPGQAGKSGKKGEDAQNPNWIQTEIKTERVKVVNPDDKEQFVIVTRITQLVFEDNETGSTLTISMSDR